MLKLFVNHICNSRPAEDRTIPLSVIAERTKLSIEDVEHLLMKSLSVSIPLSVPLARHKPFLVNSVAVNKLVSMV